MQRKTVLITGGSSGIGLATAKKFINNNYNVIITGKNIEKLKKATVDISQQFCRYIVWDAREINAINDNFQKCIDFYGKVDVLINNAGVLTDEDLQYDLLKVTPQTWDYSFDINLKSVYFMCQKAIAYMINNNIKGHIVNVSSENAFLLHALTPYYITKWGVRAMTGGIALYAAKHGIVVNGVAPGSTATKMSLRPDCNSVEMKSIPRGYMAMPEEIADLIFFLASDSANNIIGETVISSGGHNLSCPY